ncbi:MAG: L-seryl-tRNA(Sec) selenium transferase [Bryobacter sp.]|nr:L-seryl-tRNA(Sec) selenium transferase [Bryobacter sp.]
MNLTPEELRRLGSVDTLVRKLAPEFPDVPEARLTILVRAVQAEARAGKIAVEAVLDAVRRRVRALAEPTLRRVINATGVVLHTNLGRAPLPPFNRLGGYSNLEYNLATGKRGKRDEHMAPLLEALLGVRAIVVNNNAAATFLVLRALAEGGEVLVSRGELVEIGDGFRIPEIMEQSGARLREVGATNKTRIEDYRKAAGAATKMIMRVHPSNFHISGFVGKPDLAELAALGRELELPVYEDLGSGCLVDLRAFGVTEPLVGDSMAAGADVLSFSTDKLLGGPQAGIIAGRADLVEKIRRHPLYRAFRVDKLTVQALSETLRALWLERYETIPSLRMIGLPLAQLRQRVERLQSALGFGEVLESESVIGGGSTPDQTQRSVVLAIPQDAVLLERRLRAHVPPILTRIERQRVLIDLRAVEPEDDEVVVAALKTYARST